VKIYTRTGDSGSTGLFAGPRVSKDDDRIEAYGTVDELNAGLGMVRAAHPDPILDAQLHTIQSQLFAVGAELATPDPDAHQLRLIGTPQVTQLEQWIDEHESHLPALRNFILPAGTSVAATLHLARNICRRAERRVVTLVRRHEVNVSEDLLRYLNRLSDYLFVVARRANQLADVPDCAWQRPAPIPNGEPSPGV
jgi:cob(I)alamin adenosyltransferase